MEIYPFDPGLALHRAVEARLFSGQSLDPPVLDLGCSDGKFAKLCFKDKWIDNPAGLRIGVDADESFIQKTANCVIYDIAVVGNALSLPFRNETFMTVISNSVLTHISDLHGVMREAYRILKPRGRVIFSVPSIFFEEFLFPSQLFMKFKLVRPALWFAARYNKNWEQHHILDATQWKEILDESGFKLIQSEYYLSGTASLWWSLYFFMARIGIRRWRLGERLHVLFQRLKIPNKIITHMFRRQMAPFFEEDELDQGGSLFLIAEKNEDLRPSDKG